MDLKSHKEHDIFISYSSKDETVATRLLERLRAFGYSVWMDRINIVAGDDLVRNVFAGIKNSRYFAVLLTRNSAASKWVSEELSAARIAELERGLVSVIPLLYEDCRLPESLESKHYADFRTDFEKGFNSLIESLREHERRRSRSRQSASSVARRELGEVKRELIEHLNSNDSCYLAMDLGGTKAYLSLATKEGVRLYDIKFATEGRDNQDHLFSFIVHCIAEAIRGVHEKSGLSLEAIRKKIEAIGIAFPGPTDFERGVILDAPNLRMKDFPLASMIEQEFGIPTFIDNDVNLGVLGESWRGVASGFDSVVGIIIGTGIGGGIMIGGQVFRGKNHTAGEIGHLVVDYDSSVQCGCGQYGCLEALASRRAIARQIEAIKYDTGEGSLLWKEANLGSNEIADHFRNGDPVAREVVEKAGRLCGKAAFSILNLLNPEIIFFGGGFVRQLGNVFLEPVREEARRCMNAVYSVGANEIPIVLGQLDNPMLVGACRMIDQRCKSGDSDRSRTPASKDEILEGLTAHELEILVAIGGLDRPVRISKDPRSDFHEENLRRLRNRGLIKTEADRSFRNSSTVEITQLGRSMINTRKTGFSVGEE